MPIPVAHEVEAGAPAAAARRHRTLATACAAHVAHDGLSDSLYALLPLWAASFGLSHTQVGLLKTAFAATMAVGQMPLGMLAERVGARALLAAGTIGAGAAFALTALASDYYALCLFLVAAGLACAVQHPLASGIVSATFAGGGRRSALGVYNFAGDVGKIIAPLLIAAAAALLGWRFGVVLYGAAMIAAGIAIYASLRRLAAAGDAHPGASGVRAAARGWGFTDARGFVVLSAIHVIDSGSRTGFLTFFPFLLIEKGAEAATIGIALTLLFTGGAAGKLVCGLMGERFGVLRTVIATELATAALMLLFVLLPLVGATAILPLLGMALNGTSSPLYGSVGEFVRGDRQERAFGLFYTLGSAASAAAPFAFGLVSDHAGVAAALTTLATVTLATVPLCLLLARHLPGQAMRRPPA